MRSEQEMMQILLDFAQTDGRVRLAVLEGSRTNKAVTTDPLQDFDISFFVTEIGSFQKDDQWLSFLGPRLMMQKPEDMELFPPELGNWFSYLVLLEDGNKVDLTLIPLDETDAYFAESDGLVRVLIDKDSRIQAEIQPSDKKYWIQKPTARTFDDCCNEFWMVSTYVVKGIARKELLFAADHLHQIARPNLLRMMSWAIGADRGFTFSVGKNYKYIHRLLPAEDWEALASTLVCGSERDMRQALFTSYALFRKYARAVSDALSFPYPAYDAAISKYTDQILSGPL